MNTKKISFRLNENNFIEKLIIEKYKEIHPREEISISMFVKNLVSEVVFKKDKRYLKNSPKKVSKNTSSHEIREKESIKKVAVFIDPMG
jgi:hypothetical protein